MEDPERVAKAAAEMHKQADRLHHLSMLYVGAIVELVEGKPLGLIPSRSGMKTCRDVLDLMLFVRAECNALTRVLIAKGIIGGTELTEIVAEEYALLAAAKAEQFGCRVEDHGLVFENVK